MEQSQNNPLTRALDTIKKLKAQLGAQQERHAIAIVGAGLRLPGNIASLGAYWDALARGANLVGELSEKRRAPFAARWQGLPIRGGYLDQVLGFDAAFFGVSPREARALDPQHRLLLEVAWEALEHAALPSEHLTEKRTGLYLGVTGQDYRDWQQGAPDAYWATGNGHCFAAGRIAYALGLTGPTMAVDTACSSSLVALHLAAQALRTGECDVALAGGVNLVLSPRSTELVVQTRSLAPDGLCKTFDARANGFTRGEGCGVIVLKPLAHAERDGDRVLAVLHGSALNQDGRSSGFTAPNVLAQTALLEAALADAGLSASDVGLIEAHGTGTSLGDPIEMEALVNALGRKNGGRPLHVGSVKANLGHLEAAAGITGVLKVINCLAHGEVPPLVHFETLNPRIDLSGTDVRIGNARTAWDRKQSGAYAGVSSFGMSGTNAHVILGAHTAPKTRVASVTSFTISAKSESALRALAGRYAERLLSISDAEFAAFAYTASQGRALHTPRARIAASTPADAIRALTAIAQGGRYEDGASEPLPRQVIELPSYPWQREDFAPESLLQAAPARSLHYALQFERASLPASEGRRVLLVSDDAALRATAEAAGAVRTLAAMPTSDDAWDALWSAQESGTTLLLAPAGTALPDTLDHDVMVERASALCTRVTQATRSAARHGKGRVIAITQGSRQVDASDVLRASDHGLLHGLSPVLGLELSAAWGGTVDLPHAPTARDLAALLTFAQASSDEDVVAIRDGALCVGRLAALPEQPALRVRADASYLFTGGLGAIGRGLLESFFAEGARHFALFARTPESALPTDAQTILAKLRATGAEVLYASVDCDDPAALTRGMALLRALPPLAGVVHAAGALAPMPLARADEASFSAALRGKFSGAWWLHLATRALPLDFFLGLSSVTAVWGTDGYGPYGAANGGLDTVLALRRAEGLSATSIAFGPWAVAGMADEAGRAELARMGVSSLSLEDGTRSLRLRSEGAHMIACEVDWPRFASVLRVRRARPLFSTLAPAAVTPRVSAKPAATPITSIADVRGLVATHVARILGYADVAQLREEAGFFDLGMDSIMAVDLARALSDALGRTLEVSELFDHPSVHALSEHLSGHTRTKAPAQASAPIVVHAPEPARSRGPEPVAIVGVAGRFPGAESVEALWDVLREGRDAVGEVPDSRWGDDATRAGISSDQGGFLADIARFDSPFFHIPAREADSLDPQHRLLLEVAWHALEDGAIDPKSLRGSQTGVFVGISNSDYARLLEQGGLSGLDAYFGTGTALNAAAGRIAYLLGLNGPALAVDTACSSSLVALHLAVQSLRRGETSCALVGGVNVITAPACSVAVSRAHMLSPNGRCKTFSADADGFVRAEGCGVIVLKRLSDAERDGDRVLALIRGSAVNQDGASSGLTVPSGKAQEAVIRAALADAQLAPSTLDYLEAHGTGTSLGDPIEVHAAWAALSEGRTEPLLLGSIKSNIGHCESASGMAGVIKTVLALRHGELPASLHCSERNPKIAWDRMNVRVLAARTPWPRGRKERTAGVSSFGFSGTNAHVILAEAPEPRAAQASEGPFLLPLSAPDQTGLERLQTVWSTRLMQTDDVASLAYTAGVGRAQLPVRRAVVGKNREELLSALQKPAAARAPARAPRVAFLFSGQGSQHFGMGRDLYESEPVFRAVIDRADAVLAPKLGASLCQFMWAGEDAKLINQTRITQPALVAIELALAALWQSWGVTPCAVIGHSVGEIAAAIHVGVLGFEDGLTLIAERARLMQDTAPGAMLAISASLTRVRGWLEGRALDVAAINGPESTVVAGTQAEIDALAAELKAQNVMARALVVSHAFHSRLMEPALDAFHAAIRGFSCRPATLPLISNLTGAVARADEYDPSYFCRHIREPVRFHEGMEALLALGVDVCLEVGPDRTLVNLASASGLLAADAGLCSLRRGSKDRANLLSAVKALFERGHSFDFRSVLASSGAVRGEAPLYPFAGPAHWTKVERVATVARGKHWGSELRSPALSGRAFAFERTSEFPAYLTDHRLYGTVVTPAASHLGTVLSALAQNGQPLVLEDLICPRALVIKDGERFDAQILLSSSGQLSVQSLIDPERGTWQEHLAARRSESGASTRVPIDREEFVDSAERHIDGATFYRYFRELGYTLGPSFCWIAELWIRGDEALVRYAQPALPDAVGDYEIYPGLIDSCFQSIAGFMVDDVAAEAPSLAIPFAAEKLSFVGRPDASRQLFGHVRIKRADPLPRGRVRVEVADLHMFDERGQTVFAADEFRVRHAPRAVLEASLREELPNAYDVRWVPVACEPHPAPRAVALLGDVDGALAAAFRAAGSEVRLATPDALPDDVELLVDARYRDDATSAEQAASVAAEVARTLVALPSDTPYALLTGDRASAAPLREQLWGMLNAIEAEQGQRRIVRLRSEDAPDQALVDALSFGLASGELRLALRDGALAAPRLVRAEAPSNADDAFQGSVLVTGGLGALGLSVARIAAEQGARALVLMGRSQPDESAERVIAELRARALPVEVVRGDVSKVSDCKRAIEAAERHAPLGAVLHLAGKNEDKALERLARADFAATFDGKVGGALALVEALKGRSLNSLLFFSSVASGLGSAGQANYAAANGYLDGLAEQLRAACVPATAINWGPWVPTDKQGMAAHEAVLKASERAGLRALHDDEARPLLVTAATGESARLIAMGADLPRYAAHLGEHPRARFVAELVGAAAPVRPSEALPKGWLREALERESDDDREHALGNALRTLVGEVLGASEAIDDRAGFAELGLDSIMAIDVRTRLSHGLACDLPATLALDYPSVSALVGYVHGRLFPAPQRAPQPTRPKQDKPAKPELQAELSELSLEQLLSAVQLELAAGE